MIRNSEHFLFFNNDRKVKECKISIKRDIFCKLPLGGLYQLTLDLVDRPEDIAWLDLSFNFY